MAKETFKTMIGGQALIEGIMMRGPKKDAIVVRTPGGLQTEIMDRKIRPKTSPLSWPFLRGPVNFFDAQVTGVKALMRSADLSPEMEEEEPSKLDLWLEKKLGSEKFQQGVIGFSVFLGLAMSIGLFFLLPMIVSSFFDKWIPSTLVLHLLEGIVRMIIFMAYMVLVSRMQEMKRLFAYHGAEHKTITCYEEGKELTIENVRECSRVHDRCGTTFLFLVMIISILVFSLANPLVVKLYIQDNDKINGIIRFVAKVLLLPVVAGVSYEILRLLAKTQNKFFYFFS